MGEPKRRSVKVNIMMNAFLTISSLLFPLITFPYVSRILLPVGTGKVAFATSFINYFAMISQLGIPTYGIRVCAQVRDDKEKLTRTAHELLVINLVMSLISYIGLAVTLGYVGRFQEDKSLYIVISSTILLSTLGMEWLYKALEQYTYITIRSLFFKLIAFAAMFILVHEQSDYIIYGGITIFAASASNICNFINIKKYIGLRPVGNYCFTRHLKPVFVFFAMTCAATVYTNLDTVMLGFMKTDIDVGYYNAAVKIKNILTGIVTSLGAVLIPRASYYIENKRYDDFYRITKKALNLVFVIAVPLMIYFIFYAQEGIYFLSGKAYEGSIQAMQFIMPALLFIGISNILGIQMLIPLGKEKIVLYSEIAGAVVDIAINLLLIPSLGAAGAAIGTSIAELIVVIVQYYFLKKYIDDSIKSIKYYKIGIGLLVASFSTFWVKYLAMGSFLTLLISGCMFFGIYGIVLLVSKEEMTIEIFEQFLGKYIRKRRRH